MPVKIILDTVFLKWAGFVCLRPNQTKTKKDETVFTRRLAKHRSLNF